MRKVLGILIILVGIVIGGNQLDLWSFDLFEIFNKFPGWWTLFIIIPGIIDVFNKKVSEGLYTIGLGIFLCLCACDVIPWALFLPALIICVGVSLVFGFTGQKAEIKGEIKDNYIAIFGGNGSRVSGTIDNTSIKAIFGGVDLDLTDIKFKKDVVIDCFVAFGGVNIKAPKDVYIKVNGTPMFGGIENKTDSSKSKIIEVNAACVFGGIEIK